MVVKRFWRCEEAETKSNWDAGESDTDDAGVALSKKRGGSRMKCGAVATLKLLTMKPAILDPCHDKRGWAEKEEASPAVRRLVTCRGRVEGRHAESRVAIALLSCSPASHCSFLPSRRQILYLVPCCPRTRHAHQHYSKKERRTLRSRREAIRASSSATMRTVRESVRVHEE